jgi:hypothetical protein
MAERSLDCSEAWSLHEGPEGLGYRTMALRADPPDSLTLDEAAALHQGRLRPESPIEFVQHEGREPMDLLGTTIGLTLISDAFHDVLSDASFSGWTTFPVRVVLDDGSELRGYHGLAITGRCGQIDDSLCEEVVLPPPVPGGRARRGIRGLCFRPESWDGSDLFAPPDSSYLWVGDTVRVAVERAGMTNVRFQRLSEIERIWRADGSLIEE